MSVAAGSQEEPRLVDRVVAVVDDDPILLSDLERALGLGVVERRSGESDAALRRRALDWILDSRLRLHELERFGFDDAPIAEIDRGYAEIRSRFESEGKFREELDRLGLDDDKLRQLIARQIAILIYVEERLGPRVFVSVDDIRRHFDEELVPELTRRGQPAPAIEDVREEIRVVLRERRLNEEIDRWTASLRHAADVEDFLDSPRRPLPPVLPSVKPR